MRLISCRFLSDSGSGFKSDAIRCIEYCISKGAHIMSASWGGEEIKDDAPMRVKIFT